MFPKFEDKLRPSASIVHSAGLQFENYKQQDKNLMNVSDREC